MADLHLFALVFGSIVAGITLEHWRARLARSIWRAKKGWRPRGFKGRVFPFQRSGPSLATDPAEQLRTVTGAHFEKRRLLSKPEAHVFYTAERAVKDASLPWRVMAQVSLGEILSSPDTSAYAAINSKRVDVLIITNSGEPVAAIEYQGSGHYQGSAPTRDAVKKEALRKAGVRYIEVTPEHDRDDLTREILRVAKMGSLDKKSS